MKLRKLWIPMVIVTLIGGCAKISDTVLNVYGNNGFFLDSTVCNGIFIGSVVLLLFIGWGLSIADRKKEIQIAPSKNILCGLFGFLASVAVISQGILNLLSDSPNIVNCILALTGGSVLLFESCISFTGQNGIAKMPVLSLLVPVWCCSRFVTLFGEYTKKSILATEMFDIIAVAVLLMFLFYQSMFFAGINLSAAVRRSAIYGTLFIPLGLVVSIDLLIKMSMPSHAVAGIDTEVVLPTLTNILSCAGDIALCVYAFLFNRTNLKLVEEQPVSIADTSVTETPVESSASPAEEEEPPAPPENTQSAEQPTE